jgi:alkanesulfonate monooxygenase SsuD/methylene tetrahydromethanopterin reductase-like flavin-dependent oxidoreductase (luciferase family)
MQRRGRITDEYIDVMRQLWAGGCVSFDGEEYSCAGVQLSPPTRIPVWIGGQTPASFRRAGRLGDGWMPAFITPSQYGDAWTQVCESALAAGRDPTGMSRAVYVLSAIGRRDGDAEAILDPFLRSVFGAPLEMLSFACLYGTPERWADTVNAFGAAGAQHVLPLLVTTDLRADVDLLIDEVLPRLSATTAVAV